MAVSEQLAIDFAPDVSPQNPSTDELPDGWKVARLDQVCEINPSRKGRTNYPDDLPVTFVSMSAVDEGVGIIAAPDVRPFSEVKKGYTWFVENDVLFAKITPCMQNGKAAVARGLSNGVGFGSTEFHVLRSGPDVLPEWVHLFIRQPSFRAAAARHFTGSVGQQRVPESVVGAQLIPVPPLPEQHRIVARIEELAAKIERARGLRRKAVEETALAVPVAARTLIADIDAPVTELRVWLDQRRDGIQTGPFGAQLGTGDFVETGVPVLTIGNVQYSGLKLDSLKYVSEGKAQQLARFMVKAGDILFARMGTVGRCCVVPQEADGWLINYHIIRVALDTSRIDPRFIHWTIQALAEVIVTAEQLGRLHEQSAGVYGAIPQL